MARRRRRRGDVPQVGVAGSRRRRRGRRPAAMDRGDGRARAARDGRRGGRRDDRRVRRRWRVRPRRARPGAAWRRACWSGAPENAGRIALYGGEKAGEGLADEGLRGRLGEAEALVVCPGAGRRVIGHAADIDAPRPGQAGAAPRRGPARGRARRTGLGGRRPRLLARGRPERGRRAAAAGRRRSARRRPQEWARSWRGPGARARRLRPPRSLPPPRPAPSCCPRTCRSARRAPCRATSGDRDDRRRHRGLPRGARPAAPPGRRRRPRRAAHRRGGDGHGGSSRRTGLDEAPPVVVDLQGLAAPRSSL